MQCDVTTEASISATQSRPARVGSPLVPDMSLASRRATDKREMLGWAQSRRRGLRLLRDRRVQTSVEPRRHAAWR